jgi:transcriptional regulator with GAF, ATPase, and Fis domain
LKEVTLEVALRTVLWVRPGSDSDLEVPIGMEHSREYQLVPVDTLNSDIEAYRSVAPDVILVSGSMEGPEFENVLRRIRSVFHRTPLAVQRPESMASHGSYTSNPGFDYLVTQSLTSKILSDLIERATESEQREPWRSLIVGSSPAIRETRDIIHLAADRRSTVLITGETGTGKELAAKAIHLAGNRSNRQMVAINCAALPEHLLEAELFGHTKGAFTGAVNARSGLFDKAQGGTIFLDEIGEMPLSLQPKLLRVLQEREFHRLGSSDPVRINVRVIAASNSDLPEAVAERRFREDLYYRLNVVPLRMPALRERLSDIPELAEHFLEKVAEEEMRPKKRLAAQAFEFLMQYSWPGNVRQLEHAIEAATILTGDRIVLNASDFNLPAPRSSSAFGSLSAFSVPESGLNFEELISNIERQLLESALLKAGGNKARAADLLRMKRTTLISKSKALQVCA